MSRVKPAQVRFYVDADILGLGRILAGLRPDVTSTRAIRARCCTRGSARRASRPARPLTCHHVDGCSLLLALYPDAGRNADEVVIAHQAERPARAGNRRVRAT